MAKTSVSTSLQKDTSWYGNFSSPYLSTIDESIYITPFYEGFIADPNIGGLTAAGSLSGGTINSPRNRYAITRTQVQGGGGNDDYVVGSYSTDTTNYRFGEIKIATGGAGYNTFTWNNTEAFKAWPNASSNMVVSRSGNDLSIVFDVLVGGLGNDTLEGGAGADTFVFNSDISLAINKAYVFSNIDTITDFTVAQSDRIALDHNIFTKLVGVTDLSNYFTTTSPSKATDYIQYNKSTGELSYDVDGNGAGVAQVFAVLTNKPSDLVASSFTVI